MKVFLFPGQGSQKRGMGEELFVKYPDLVATANSVLGYDIANLCIRDPDRQLNKTQYTQPALYVVGALTYLDRINGESEPDYVLGHSLGEYVALFAAGAFTFETGLQLVKRRAELMSMVENGSMAAILGLTMPEIEQILAAHDVKGIDIANYNSANQIVISGLKDDIIATQQIVESSGASYFLLNVSGPFHSRYMETAAAAFGTFVRTFQFSPTKIPVIANVTALPYQHGVIADMLEQQITKPVRWYESVSRLLQVDDASFFEMGTGTVLTKMLDFIKKEPMPTAGILPPETLSQADRTVVKNRGEIQPIIKAKDLGSAAFKADYGIKYAYLSGAMVHGISSKEMVVKMAKAGLMGYFGTGGLKAEEIEKAIRYIQQELQNGESYGMNLLNGSREQEAVSLFLKYKVRNIEASAYMQISPQLVRLRLTGAYKKTNGSIETATRIVAKLSRPEVAAAFLSPPPPKMVEKCLLDGLITPEEAALAGAIPMADDICVESDSGGHTDQGVAFTLLPTIMKQRDESMNRYPYKKRVRVGAAGGIGTPEAAAAAFIMGADFILTGSINQCTVESGMSEAVKDMLQDINVQDTEYAPAGDMFEIGARVQVLKKGSFFSGRANKLYELYRQHNSIDEIDEKTKGHLQERYFKRSFDDVYKEVKAYFPPEEIAVAERNPKQKMAYVFRWYFGYANRLALVGDVSNRADFQVHCGPALGAFNQWVKGTALQSWRSRHVDEIAEKMMKETADFLNVRISNIIEPF